MWLHTLFCVILYNKLVPAVNPPLLCEVKLMRLYIASLKLLIWWTASLT